MVGTAGFEPTTTCTPSKCATRLRYVPIRPLARTASYHAPKRGSMQPLSFYVRVVRFENLQNVLEPRLDFLDAVAAHLAR